MLPSGRQLQHCSCVAGRSCLLPGEGRKGPAPRPVAWDRSVEGAEERTRSRDRTTPSAVLLAASLVTAIGIRVWTVVLWCVLLLHSEIEDLPQLDALAHDPFPFTCLYHAHPDHFDPLPLCCGRASTQASRSAERMLALHVSCQLRGVAQCGDSRCMDDARQAGGREGPRTPPRPSCPCFRNCQFRKQCRTGTGNTASEAAGQPSDAERGGGRTRGAGGSDRGAGRRRSCARKESCATSRPSPRLPDLWR